MWPFASPKRQIVMICTANICRSTAAEALMRQHLQRLGLKRKVAVCSAGTSVGAPGAPPDPRVVSILREQGVGTRAIRATAVSEKILAGATDIWVMESTHIADLQRMFGDLPVYPILLDPGGKDIADPYFGAKAGVRATVETIAAATRSRAEKMARDWPPYDR